MSKENIITAIDIGSSKISTLIANVIDERVSVIGVSTVPSKGIKKGTVVDIDEAVEAISDSLESAERMAGYSINSAFITVGGNHIESVSSHGVVAVSNQGAEITPVDVERVTEAAQALSIPSTKEIIHVIPRDFIVDKQDGIKDPIGMSGIRLEVVTEIITASTTSLKNLVKCVQQVGVDVEAPVFTGIASAGSVLTSTEKELGTVLVDIGGGTTSITIYHDTSPVYASVLPIGGQHITNDLAIGLRSSIDIAEQVKLKVSTVMGDEITEADIDFAEFGLDAKDVSIKLINQIIGERLKEIFTLVATEVNKSSYVGKVPSGIVLTGGASNTFNAVRMAKQQLRVPVRIGTPSGVTGLIDEIQGPAYASVVGALLYGTGFSEEKGSGINLKMIDVGNAKNLLKKVLGFVKGLMP